MKISIVGAGPSGLYLSILIKHRCPHWDIKIVEQNAADSTFGFGVVLAEAGLSRLRAADAPTHDALVEKMIFTTHQIITTRETPISIRRPNAGGGAIARIDLLQILQKEATDAGVQIEFGVRVQDMADLDAAGLSDADVIVGADGINSSLRTACESQFGTTRESLTNHFAWFGVGKAFPTAALVFREHRGGAFIAHYYPYSESNSTFVAECDDATWQTFGMAAMTAEQRQQLFEEVFAPELDGHALISNNSTWRQFPVIRNARWAAGKVVLIGDAETSAHFSIGSGTRIAMDDAIALADALVNDGDDAAVTAVERLARFAASRGPEKLKLIAASEKSYRWYESIGEWMKRYTPYEFIYAFMTRTGRIDEGRLAAAYPELMQQIKLAQAQRAHAASADVEAGSTGQIA
ncbi:FAD-dependent monooxygenase [Variovorax sp. Root411]|uniref:FAD-dependent monooxygenase n=1 Tax=Variovorax sp. Root411 TaxID=1736530 RepID=UPI0006F6FE01|nr:FAD-dependent monooxygenase [Variovorax sp. Root411]KQW64904.1 monooxygenase [Variovorax sp. Root411]